MLHSSLMTCADYFEAACLRRVKVERQRLKDSIVMEPLEGRTWNGNLKARKQTRKRKKR